MPLRDQGSTASKPAQRSTAHDHYAQPRPKQQGSTARHSAARHSASHTRHVCLGSAARRQASLQHTCLYGICPHHFQPPQDKYSIRFCSKVSLERINSAASNVAHAACLSQLHSSCRNKASRPPAEQASMMLHCYTGLTAEALAGSSNVCWVCHTACTVRHMRHLHRTRATIGCQDAAMLIASNAVCHTLPRSQKVGQGNRLRLPKVLSTGDSFHVVWVRSP